MEKFTIHRLLGYIVVAGSLIFGVTACDNNDSSTPPTTENEQPSIPEQPILPAKAIGYIASQEYRENKLNNQSNLDLDKYDILNYAYFGVAKDGSLLSRAFANPDIYKEDQEPGSLLDRKDNLLLFGDADLITQEQLDASEEFQTQFKEQGFEIVSDEKGDRWQNSTLGSSGAFPVPLKKAGGQPGLIELAHQHQVPLLASIGGPLLSKHFADTIADPTKLETFLAGIDQLIDLGFDGIDINWIYPGTGSNGRRSHSYDVSDYDAFAQLIEAVRDQIGKDRVLTAAFNSDPGQIYYMDWRRLAQSLDYFNMLTYNYADNSSDYVGYIAPLYASTDYPDATNNGSFESLRQYLLTQDIPLNKVNFAVPFFGRILLSNVRSSANIIPGRKLSLFDYSLETVNGYGPVRVYRSTYNDSRTPYFQNYSVLVTPDGWIRGEPKWDEGAQVPYTTNGDSITSYENEDSVAAKAQYAKTNHLAGLVVWHVFGDLICDGTPTDNQDLPHCESNTTPLTDAMDAVFKSTDEPAATTDAANDSNGDSSESE